MKLTASVALVSVLAAGASANLVVNGSFENPDQGYFWSFLSNDGVAGGWFADFGAIEIGHYHNYGVAADDGDQVVELDAQGNSAVSQYISLGAGYYTFSFDYALRPDTFEVYFDSYLLGSFASTSNAWTTYSVAGYLPTSATAKLSFVATGTSDTQGAIIDNVSIVESVPEPASMALLGVGAMAFIRRRRPVK